MQCAASNQLANVMATSRSRTKRVIVAFEPSRLYNVQLPYRQCYHVITLFYVAVTLSCLQQHNPTTYTTD